MSANTTPIFVGTPKVSSCLLDSANTARDGSGTLVTLFTAGVNGSRVDFITFTSAQAAPAAASAKVLRVFVTDGAGANPRLLQEVAISAVTASNTAIGATTTITFTNGLVLGAGQVVKVSQSVRGTAADDMHVIARGGDY